MPLYIWNPPFMVFQRKYLWYNAAFVGFAYLIKTNPFYLTFPAAFPLMLIAETASTLFRLYSTFKNVSIDSILQISSERSMASLWRGNHWNRLREIVESKNTIAKNKWTSLYPKHKKSSFQTRYETQIV